MVTIETFEKMATSVGKKKKKKTGKNCIEWRLLHEKEQKEKREKLLFTYLQDKITRESASARLNAIKLDWQWRKVLRNLKWEELQEETMQTREVFEHLVAAKDKIIELLMEEIIECEQQRSESFRTQLQSTDEILGIQRAHLTDLERQLDEHLRRLHTQAGGQQDGVQAVWQAADDAVRDLAQFCMENNDNLMKSIEAEFQSRKYDILNKIHEEEKVLKLSSQATADNLLTELNHVLSSEEEDSQEIRKSIHNMKMKDQIYKKEIQQQQHKINKLQETVEHLKERLAILSDEELSGVREQQEQKQQVAARACQARNNMHELKGEWETKMMVLAGVSSQAIQYLEANVRAVERVLRWNKLCDAPEELAAKEKDEEEEVEIAVNEEEERIQQAMTLFWRDYNQNYFEKSLLRSENQQLQFDNLKLRNVMKQYMDSHALPPLQ